ncbi:hypothetical protein [Massilia sp. LjRoot122]|uniref:hypothetical protein n=1 Tax=Massilia sp. LjRoot122 TaxID=3342257 RepID=UPI003ECCCC8E
MATIVIKDLPESTELDRQAMFAIAGGSRQRSGGVGRLAVPRTGTRRLHLFDLAPGAAAGTAARQAARPPSR